MSGRDPDERGRSATPLELLFDLTFVIAFSHAANQLAHLLAEGHVRAGLLGFGFATFAICWAWINFAWFASAYDTDDWIYRLTTMVQMVGVLILAIGLPRMFESIDTGDGIDNAVMVLGYVVMRVAMVFQWLRAARQDPIRRHACLIFAKVITLAQIGWVAMMLWDASVPVTVAVVVVLYVIELAGPVLAERRSPTPWHAHHIAERYGLLTIICLGEGIVGTVASLSAVVQARDWTVDTALVGLAGTGLIFGMWWMYFVMPSGEVLHVHRRRAFVWGYGHMVIFGSIVATGAGLHVCALYAEGQAEIGVTATVWTVVVPVAIYVASIYLLYIHLVRSSNPFHLLLVAATAAALGLAVVVAGAGGSMPWCLVIVAAAPLVTVVGYETLGHRHLVDALEEATAQRR